MCNGRLVDYLRENWIAFTKGHERGNYSIYTILLMDDQIHYQDCLRSFHPSSLLRSSSFYRPVMRTASLAIKIALGNQYLTLRRINVLEGVSTMSMG